MLKGLDPLLCPDLLRALRAMGHGDEIAVVDGNYPAETDARRLVRLDGHRATDILAAILSVMPVDTVLPDNIFRPAAGNDPARMEPIFEEFAAIVRRHAHGSGIAVLIGANFYNRVRGCYAVVASGERRLYGNIILRKGVIAPD